MRLKSLNPISAKAYLAIAFDGSEAVIPKSQVFGLDFEVKKSESYWISAWILQRVELQYSKSKEAIFANGKIIRTKIEYHTPKEKEEILTNELKELKR